MNVLTKKIKNKGYSLTEFCDENLISLRTYRRWENESNKNYKVLNRLIDELENKQ
tara:strand:- start:1557 stop:1721 length:165 start_codon:yes stop_codon:yes gene_type:complete